MREIISLNGTYPAESAVRRVFFVPHRICPTPVLELAALSASDPGLFVLTIASAVGQAGCQIANSCWEVSSPSPTPSAKIRASTPVTDFFRLLALLPRTWNPGMHEPSPPGHLSPAVSACLLTISQPDGYLTEERKAADPDHGFSTFFSETGTCRPAPIGSFPTHTR